jgi:NAD(P)-dependent dehydrogenase (short-subunit alcohol dehydrogenase family)
VALVVGAGSSASGTSIGRAVAVAFAREGAKVCAFDIDADEAAETASQAMAAGGECIAHAGDATEPDDVAAGVARCAAAFGGLDVLHNNVGVMAFGDPVDLDLAEWDRVTRVNGRSCFLACKYAVPQMRSRGGGAIVNMSSIAAIRSTGAPYHVYAASKAAIIGLTRSLALEYASAGIRVNCVVPGFIESPMMRGGVAQQFGPEAVERLVADKAARLPLGRLGMPEDVARACVFLASEDAAYITGTSLVVDGGVSAGCRS